MDAEPRSRRLVLAIFLVVAWGCQVVVHLRLGRGWALALGYAVGSALLLGLVVLLLRRFSPDEPPAEVAPGRPRTELVLAAAAVFIHVAALLPQVPSAALAHNPVSAALLRLGTPLRALTSASWAQPLFFGAVIPCLLLVPLRPRAEAFGVRGFRWQIGVGIALLYVPLLFLTGAAPTAMTSISYLLGAALPEELLYRAILQQRLEHATRRADLSLVLASLVFGFMHLPVNAHDYGWTTALAFCVGQNAFGGFITGCIYQRTRSLPLVVLQHAWAGIVMGAAG